MIQIRQTDSPVSEPLFWMTGYQMQQNRTRLFQCPAD